MQGRVLTIGLLSSLGALVLSLPLAAHDMRQKMDTDNDGKISASEHAAFAKEAFDRMDANNDGKVTVAEWDAGHARLKHRVDQATGGEHATHASATGHGMAGTDMRKALDTNGDGDVTEAEYASWASQRFAKADADHDGNLTVAEMKAAHAAMQDMDDDDDDMDDATADKTQTTP